MAKVSIPNLKHLDAKVLGKLLSDLKRGIETYDLNGGWEVATGTKEHRLKNAPQFVQIQVSDDAKGASWRTIHPDTVTDTVITYTTLAAYVRILANR